MKPICNFVDFNNRLINGDRIFYRCKAMPFQCSCSGFASCVRYRPFDGQIQIDFEHD